MIDIGLYTAAKAAGRPRRKALRNWMPLRQTRPQARHKMTKNPSEGYISELCSRSFFSLWSK